MRPRRLANTVGFDDAPFARGHQGHVPIVGAVFADRQFDGVLVATVEKDRADAMNVLASTIATSRRPNASGPGYAVEAARPDRRIRSCAGRTGTV